MMKSNRGQGMIEYLIIVALVAVGAMGVMRIVGTNVNRNFANIANSLGAEGQNEIKAIAATESVYKKRDMTDFMSGSGTNSSSSNQKSSSQAPK